MGETRIGFDDTEPSAEHTAINVADIRERLPRLEKKLVEYRKRAEEQDIAYLHPALLALQDGLRLLFKTSILESTIALAKEKDADEKVYLHEVALLVKDKTGINVTRAATIPFRYDEDSMVYMPDYRQLREKAGQAEIDFSDAYAIIRGYCRGVMWGIAGGTGLPEA